MEEICVDNEYSIFKEFSPPLTFNWSRSISIGKSIAFFILVHQKSHKNEKFKIFTIKI